MQYATVRPSKGFTGTRVPSMLAEATTSGWVWGDTGHSSDYTRYKLKFWLCQRVGVNVRTPFFQGHFACWDYRCSANSCDLCKADIVITAQKQTKKVIRPNILTFPMLAPVQGVICIPACVFDRLDQREPPDVWATITKNISCDAAWSSFSGPFSHSTSFLFHLYLWIEHPFLAVFMMCQIEAAKSPWKAKRTDGERLISSHPGSGWPTIQSRKEIKSSNKKKNRHQGPLCSVLCKGEFEVKKRKY